MDYNTAKSIYSLQCSAIECERNRTIPTVKKESEGFTALAILLVIVAGGLYYYARKGQSSS
jgi:hypothetical protein